MVYRSEDTLLFYGLTPGLIDSIPIQNALTEFCKKKKSMSSSDRFNLIMFLKDGPNYLENFTLNPDHILIALKNSEEDLVKGNISAGIFLAIKLVIEVFKSISERCFHLVLILDSQSNDIPIDKVSGLMNLIDKVREMPLVIDIISISTNTLSEDPNLKKLAEKSGGNLYTIKNIKKLDSILNSLAEKKEFVEFYDTEESVTHISEENFPFYENFADKPIEIEEIRTCSICYQKGNNLVQCTKCDTYAHKNCWALWSKSTHIGLPNVFRCHKCFNLLKLDKNLVEMVHSGILIYEELQLGDVQKRIDEIKIINVEKYLQDMEARERPKVIQIEYPKIFLDLEDDDITIIVDDD